MNNNHTTAFPFINHPPRPAKPRETGITMVLDKNLTVFESSALAETAGDYIDLIKLGWGTSAVFRESAIREKCEIFTQADIKVCPGGTLTELAFLQGSYSEFLAEAQRIGFTCIEVSNGTVPMTPEEKHGLISEALEKGFRVVSEVGFKSVEEDSRLDMRQRIEATRAELALGVWKVIFEARESGTLGIFDSSGKTQFSMLRELEQAVDIRSILFEAPQKSQQVDLLKVLGPNANLGNIAPGEVISLETLRRGFRGDTLRHFHVSMPTLSVELGPGGADAASRRGDVIIVVDAIRASSTIVTALAHGMVSVQPVNSAKECVGEVTAGERGGKKIPGLDYDNSPVAFANDLHRGQQLVLTTSNGTECLLAATTNPEATVFVGSMLNVAAVTAFALEVAQTEGRNLSVVIAGRNNQPVVEDLLVAAEIAYLLPGAPVRSEMELRTSKHVVSDFLASESGKNLAENDCTEDVIWCAQKDKYDVVPVFSNGKIIRAK